MKIIAASILSAALAAAAMHYSDAVTVRDTLQSDDLSITRNVEQTDMLLSAYEKTMTPEQKQAVRDSIKRDANGLEIQ